MRILFTCAGGLGHLYPLLPLARAARAAGHQVLFAAPAGSAADVRRLGYPVAVSSDGEAPREAAEFWGQLPRQDDPNTYVIAGLFGGLRVKNSLARVRALVHDFGPDLVISECMEFAAPLVAERLDIPQISVLIAGTEMPGFQVAPLLEQLNRWRVGLGLGPAAAAPWHTEACATWLPPLIQPAVSRPGRAGFRYRYEYAEPAAAGPSDAAEWGGRRATVYATLGSAAPGQAAAVGVYRGMLEGLGAADAEVLFSIGSLDPGVLGPVPANVTVTAYARQREAMTRDVVVHHGGSGTTVATLFSARPAVVVPIFADQPYNAATLVRSGLGVRVGPPAVADELPGAIATVVQDNGFRARVEQIAAEMAAVPAAEDVLDSILQWSGRTSAAAG